MFIYVGGIPGAGKTTVIRRSVELAKKNNFSLQFLDEKKMLCQITGAKSAEDYSKLSQEIRVEARRKIASYFYELDGKDLSTIRIRDDHFTAPKRDGTYWVRQLEEKDKVHMIAFVVIVAKPDIILQRRLSRDFIPPEPYYLDMNTITCHQEIEIQAASLQTNYLQIPLKIVENEAEKTEHVSTLLLNFVQEVTKRKLG